jgi:hypothetical protein
MRFITAFILFSILCTPSVRATEDCADFSGTWEATCYSNVGEIKKLQTTLQQDGCEAIGWGTTPKPVGATAQFDKVTGETHGYWIVTTNWGAGKKSWRWDTAEQNRTDSKQELKVALGHGTMYIQGDHLMWDYNWIIRHSFGGIPNLEEVRGHCDATKATSTSKRDNVSPMLDYSKK